MEALTLERLRGMAALGGFTWSDDDLLAVAPQLERALAAMEKLTTLSLRDLDPSVVFRAE